MKIIGLYGPPTVGKSTVATAIEHITKPYGYKRMSFASTIRDMLKPILPDSLLSPFADKEKPIEFLGGKSVRQLLKSLGTEWGRDMVCGDIWVNSLFNRAASLGYDNLVIDDLRMDNEYHAIKRLGGMVVRINREGIAPCTSNHASEVQWPKWIPDVTVENSTPTACAQKIVLNAVQFFNK